jgi:hypothetical protein
MWINSLGFVLLAADLVVSIDAAPDKYSMYTLDLFEIVLTFFCRWETTCTKKQSRIAHLQATKPTMAERNQDFNTINDSTRTFAYNSEL